MEKADGHGRHSQKPKLVLKLPSANDSTSRVVYLAVWKSGVNGRVVFSSGPSKDM